MTRQERGQQPAVDRVGLSMSSSSASSGGRNGAMPTTPGTTVLRLNVGLEEEVEEEEEREEGERGAAAAEVGSLGDDEGSDPGGSPGGNPLVIRNLDNGTDMQLFKARNSPAPPQAPLFASSGGQGGRREEEKGGRSSG